MGSWSVTVIVLFAVVAQAQVAQLTAHDTVTNLMGSLGDKLVGRLLERLLQVWAFGVADMQKISLGKAGHPYIGSNINPTSTKPYAPRGISSIRPLCVDRKTCRSIITRGISIDDLLPPDIDDPEARPVRPAEPKPGPQPGPRTAALPPPDDLSDKVMLSMVQMEMSDEDVNKLAWKYLGYRYDENSGKWDASNVFPEFLVCYVDKFAKQYPEPPDLVGVIRYDTSEEIDASAITLLAQEALHKMVPTEHKQNLRAFLIPLGWRGFKPEELSLETGPNKRRRAHLANWLFYYREALHGVSIKELARRREERALEAQRTATPIPTIGPTTQPIQARIDPKPGPRTAALPPPDDLSDKVMLSIVQMKMSDEDVNRLAWKYLGYRYNETTGIWDASNVFPKWAEKYPLPPDFLGITRNYMSREIDEPVLLAKDALANTVPMAYKDNLRAFLKPLGWKGFQLEELTPEIGPNKRRRAHVANWLLYYREALHGVSIEELVRRREERAAEAQRKANVVRKPGPRTAVLPPPDDLSDNVMLSIVKLEMSDEDVNRLAWKYLGYQYNEVSDNWNASNVFPEWAEKYPQPPDLIGVTRNYTREIDEPVLVAVETLQKSIPKEHRDNLRVFLKPLGWTGIKIEEREPILGPNKIRRAHIANWLCFYRQALHGVPIKKMSQQR